jgi:hypothetical protein
MPPTPGYNAAAGSEPVEFSVEDAMLNTWVDDTSVYLKLDDDAIPHEGPPQDQS